MGKFEGHSCGSTINRAFKFSPPRSVVAQRSNSFVEELTYDLRLRSEYPLLRGPGSIKRAYLEHCMYHD